MLHNEKTPLAHVPQGKGIGSLYLLWCKLCEWQVPVSQDNPLPFGDAMQRRDWAMAHQKGTGHNHFHTFTSNTNGTAWSTVMNLNESGML